MNIIHLTNYDSKTLLRVNVDQITCYGASSNLKNCTMLYTMAGCCFMVTESPEEIDLEINEVNMRNTPKIEQRLNIASGLALKEWLQASGKDVKV